MCIRISGFCPRVGYLQRRQPVFLALPDQPIKCAFTVELPVVGFAK